jgi:hypothetical protein
MLSLLSAFLKFICLISNNATTLKTLQFPQATNLVIHILNIPLFINLVVLIFNSYLLLQLILREICSVSRNYSTAVGSVSDHCSVNHQAQGKLKKKQYFKYWNTNIYVSLSIVKNWIVSTAKKNNLLVMKKIRFNCFKKLVKITNL